MAVKVSVLIKTFNHERFIAQAVESVATQQSPAAFEIVVAEDCSTDGTRAVLAGLQQKYPDRVRLLLREKNLGFMKNFTASLPFCQGEYVAWLDGDDFWTSPHKLRKQVDFLDAHPAYSSCAHGIVMVDASGAPLPNGVVTRPDWLITLPDMLAQCRVSTTSVLFRRKCVEKLPDWFHAMPKGDWPLYALCLQHGPMHFDAAVMGAYRIHAGGMHSGANEARQRLANIAVQRQFLELFGATHGPLLRGRLARQHLLLACCLERQGELAAVRYHVREAFRIGRWHPRLLVRSAFLRLAWRLGRRLAHT